MIKYAVFAALLALSVGMSRSYTIDEYEISNQCKDATAEVVVHGTRMSERTVKLKCSNGNMLEVKEVSVVHNLTPTGRANIISAFARKEAAN